MCVVEEAPEERDCIDPASTAEEFMNERKSKNHHVRPILNPGVRESMLVRVEPWANPEQILRGEDAESWACLKQQAGVFLLRYCTIPHRI